MAVRTPSKPYTHIQKKTRKKNHLIIILLDNYIGPQTIKPFCVCSFAHILLVCTVAPGSGKGRQSTSAHDRFWQFSSFRNSFKHCFLILCPSGFVVEVSKLKSASQFQKFNWVSHFSAKHWLRCVHACNKHSTYQKVVILICVLIYNGSIMSSVRYGV